MIIGTRGSELALWQARAVQAVVGGELRVITTQGDVSLAERLVGTLEKGFFTEELEAALVGHGVAAIWVGGGGQGWFG